MPHVLSLQHLHNDALERCWSRLQDMQGSKLLGRAYTVQCTALTLELEK